MSWTHFTLHYSFCICIINIMLIITKYPTNVFCEIFFGKQTVFTRYDLFNDEERLFIWNSNTVGFKLQDNFTNVTDFRIETNCHRDYKLFIIYESYHYKLFIIYDHNISFFQCPSSHLTRSSIPLHFFSIV